MIRVIITRGTRGIAMKNLVKISIALLLVIASGCAQHWSLPPEEVHTFYAADLHENSLLRNYTPVFLTYDHKNDYNRIGSPAARINSEGNEQIYVDPEKPAIYYMKKNFSTEKGNYTNLIFRVHFPKVPFSIIPFNLTSGSNVGLIVIITLDKENRPLLVTSANTCGCYMAIVPTTYLPPEALPQDWKQEPVEVYGEELPWILDYGEKRNPRLLVHLRPSVHRVMDLEIVDDESLSSSQGFRSIQAPLIPTNELESIPLQGGNTSFYYDYGPQKGHVKGSMKFWETLLLSIISWDFFVGADKIYGDNEKYENPFYTSLKPWNRTASDMWNFARFLEFWGWRL
jgi:hypothetical protein